MVDVHEGVSPPGRPEQGPATASRTRSAGVHLAVVDGALVAAADPGMREAVLESTGEGAAGPDMLIGAEPVALPVGSRVQIGPFTVIVQGREVPTLPRQRDDRSVTQVLAMLDSDRVQAMTALASSQEPQTAYATLVAAAVERARRALSDGIAFVPAQYSPRLAVVHLVEDLGTEFAGEGRTTRLPRSVVTTPAVMVGAGTMIVLTVMVSGGPASVLLSQDGFDKVAAVKLRRLTSLQLGVEWQYTDQAHHDGHDMSMPRMVVGFPLSAGALLCQAWQQRVLAMIKPQGW